MFFGAISGSAVADVSSIGTIMIPMIKEKGCDADYSVAVTVTSACLKTLAMVMSLIAAAILFPVVVTVLGRISIEHATRAMLPFYAVMIVVLMFVTFVPDLVMFIPDLLMP